MATTLVYDYERCESDSENDRESVILEFEIEEEYSLSDSASDEEISSVDVDEIRPYMYEPEADSDEENLEDDFQVQAVPVAEGPRGRNQTLDWCVCDNCQLMPTVRECKCCQEIGQVAAKLQEGSTVYNQDPYRCIVEHPGFQAACLNVHVLEIAWLQYRQQYNDPIEGPEHKRKRHIAYRQLARWCWSFLGRSVRVVLPACAVSCIRAHFQPPGLEDDMNFVGYLP